MMSTAPESISTRMRERHHLSGDTDVRIKYVTASSPLFDPDRREYAVVANTADVDLDHEVVLPKGALPSNGGSMDYFLRNRKLFWGHNYEGLSIGQLSRDPSLKRKGWFLRMRISKTGFGHDLVAMMSDGMYPGASIGFVPLESHTPTPTEVKAFGDHDLIHTAWQWLETSLTHMPCNPACQAVSEVVATETALARAAADGKIAWKSAIRMGLEGRKVWPTRGPAIPRTSDRGRRRKIVIVMN